MARVPVSGWFIWHELYTPNAAGAHEFYATTLGWQQQPWEGDPSYVMFKGARELVGATVESKSATPHWLPYLSTRDVDATIEAAGRLGGRVETPATPLPNGGRYAVLVDPQGARFGIHADATPAETAPPPGEFSWHELATSVAPGIAFGFYGALFDWDEISEYDMGDMGLYLIFGRNGRQLGGMFDKGAAGNSGPAYWLGYVGVTDLEGTVERAKTARGSLLMGPMDVPGGDRVAQLMDPYGAFFALHKAAAQSAQAARAETATTTDATRSSTRRAERKPAKKAAKKARKKAATRAAAGRKKRPAKKAAAKKTAAKKAAAKRAKPARKKAKKRAAKKAPSRKPAKARPSGKKKTKKRGRR